MITIPTKSEWIEVDSAFGGLAIYKKHTFDAGEKYIGLSNDGKETCEHVYFNMQLRKAGYRIFINPKMTNSAYNEHSEELFLRRKIKRKIDKIKSDYSYIKGLLRRFIRNIYILESIFNSIKGRNPNKKNKSQDH